jgi:hypothetical protein
VHFPQILCHDLDTRWLLLMMSQTNANDPVRFAVSWHDIKLADFSEAAATTPSAGWVKQMHKPGSTVTEQQLLSSLNV